MMQSNPFLLSYLFQKFKSSKNSCNNKAYIIKWYVSMFERMTIRKIGCPLLSVKIILLLLVHPLKVLCLFLGNKVTWHWYRWVILYIRRIILLNITIFQNLFNNSFSNQSDNYNNIVCIMKIFINKYNINQEPIKGLRRC